MAHDAQGGASTKPTETPRRATKRARQDSEKFLREMCDFFTLCANTGDHDNPIFWRHMAEDFTLNMIDTHRVANRCEYVQYMADVRAAHPKWQIEVLDCNIEVREKLGTAKSWIMMKHTGWPEGCEREALNIFSWKRDEEGVWVCDSHQGFQGVAPLPLPFHAAMPAEEAEKRRRDL